MKKVISNLIVGIVMIATLLSSTTAFATADSRFANLSGRIWVGTGENVLIGGFVIGGTGTKLVLMRGVGPNLGKSPINLAGALQDTTLRLFDKNGTQIGINSHWDGSVATQLAANKVGAFPLALESLDSAILVELPASNPSVYSAQLAGTNGATGIGLLEAYDCSGSLAFPKMINMSIRALGGEGAKVLIGGFVIDGLKPRKVLIRAVGPALGTLGVQGYNPDPQVIVYNGAGVEIARNDNWWQPQAEPNIAALMAKLGAYPFASGSKDAAIVLTLNPGSYSVFGTSPGGDKVTLVELYDADGY